MNQIEGIQILNTFNFFTGADLVFVGVVFLILFGVLLIITGIEKIVWAVIICGIFTTVGIFAICYGVDMYETRYKVTLSKDVSFTNFVEQFNIIEQRGEIFVITPRDEDNDTLREYNLNK